MADFTITVQNSFNVFGLEPSTKWNFFNWGQSWGYGVETTLLEIEKSLAETMTVTDSLETSIGYNMILETQIVFDSNPIEETLQDGNGYYYVFTRPSIDAEDRNLTSFVANSRASTNWTEPSTATTSWSED